MPLRLVGPYSDKLGGGKLNFLSGSHSVVDVLSGKDAKSPGRSKMAKETMQVAAHFAALAAKGEDKDFILPASVKVLKIAFHSFEAFQQCFNLSANPRDLVIATPIKGTPHPDPAQADKLVFQVS